MAFTAPAADGGAVKRWMDERAPAAACPLCRMAGDWRVGSQMEIGSGPAAGSVVPLVCQHCGHVELLSALSLSGLRT